MVASLFYQKLVHTLVCLQHFQPSCPGLLGPLRWHSQLSWSCFCSLRTAEISEKERQENRVRKRKHAWLDEKGFHSFWSKLWVEEKLMPVQCPLSKTTSSRLSILCLSLTTGHPSYLIAIFLQVHVIRGKEVAVLRVPLHQAPDLTISWSRL